MYEFLITSQCGNYEHPANGSILHSTTCVLVKALQPLKQLHQYRFQLSSFLPLLLTALMGTTQAQRPPFDIQGHRGCRGLMPENSIPAFLMALDLGVSTLELDVVISKDSQVVVSHDPYINPAFCLLPDGRPVDKKNQKNFTLYQMTYEQIRQYDCGSNGNPAYPNQQKIPVVKPLLSEVIRQAEMYRIQQKLPLFSYNIELKSSSSQYGLSQPPPEQFVTLVHQVLAEHLTPERVIIQSFDFRVLQYWKQQMDAHIYPPVRLSALISNLKSLNSQLKKLGFVPDIYSPDFRLLNSKRIARIHTKGMQVIPWTVNDSGRMKKLKDWGADGLITDFPDRAKNL